MGTKLTYTDISSFAEDEEEMGRLSPALPEYYRLKISATKNPELKRQRTAGALLLADALMRRGYPAGETDITEGAQGKPLFRDLPGLYFNLSHSGDLVLLAVSDAEVGCDIQKIKSGGKIADRFFTERENRALAEAGDDERDELFTRFWARKESYIKATGEGMRRSLGSFSVTDDMTPDRFAFRDHVLGGYVAAVCVKSDAEGCDPAVDICFLPFQNLVNVIL